MIVPVGWHRNPQLAGARMMTLQTEGFMSLRFDAH
jgi:hypothetical protein